MVLISNRVKVEPDTANKVFENFLQYGEQRLKFNDFLKCYPVLADDGLLENTQKLLHKRAMSALKPEKWDAGPFADHVSSYDEPSDPLEKIYKALADSFGTTQQKHFRKNRNFSSFLKDYLKSFLDSPNQQKVNSLLTAELLGILIKVGIEKGSQEKYFNKLAAVIYQNLAKVSVDQTQDVHQAVSSCIEDVLSESPTSRFPNDASSLRQNLVNWAKSNQNPPPNLVANFILSQLRNVKSISESKDAELQISNDCYGENKPQQLRAELTSALYKAVLKYAHPVLKHVDSAINNFISTLGASDQTKFLAQAANPSHVLPIKHELFVQKNRELVHNEQVDQRYSEWINESNSDLKKVNSTLIEAEFFNEQLIKICLLHKEISNSPDGTDFGKFFSSQKVQAYQNWLTAFSMLEDTLVKNYSTLNRSPAYLLRSQTLEGLRYDYCEFFKFIDKLPGDLQILRLNLLPLKEIEHPSSLCDLDQVNSFLAIIRKTFTTTINEFELFKNAVNNPGGGASAPRTNLLSPPRLTDFISRQRQCLALAGQANQAIRYQNVEKLLTLMVSTFKLEPLSATLIYNAIFTETGTIFYDKGEQHRPEALKYAADIHAAIAHPFDFKAEPQNLQKRAKKFWRRPTEDVLANAIPRAPSDDQIKAYREARQTAQKFLASTAPASTAPASTTPATAAPSYTVPSYMPPAPAAIPAAPAPAAIPAAPVRVAPVPAVIPAVPALSAPEPAAPESVTPSDSVMGTDQTKITQDSSLLTDLKKRFANPNAFEALEKIAIELDAQEKSVQSGYFREPELLKLGQKMYRTAQIQQFVDQFLAQQDEQDFKAVEEYSKKLREYQKARAEGKYFQEPKEPILLDAIEVKLHMWSELSKTLKLPIATQLTQFNMAKIDVNEIYGISTEKVGESILENERKDNYAELMKFLANWQPWRKHLDRVEKDNINAALKPLKDQWQKDQERLDVLRVPLAGDLFNNIYNTVQIHHENAFSEVYLKYTDTLSSRRFLGLNE